MNVKYVALWFAIGLFSSCSSGLTYFTKDLYDQEKWSPGDVERIQFYLSRDIVLTRSLGTGETRISEGKIEMVDGRRVERVILRANTPGVLVHMPKEDRFAISFEEADDEAFLMFGPSAKRGNQYVLLAQEWKRDLGQVHYKGKLYTVDASSASASLMVNLKKEGVSEYQARKVSGRTIKE